MSTADAEVTIFLVKTRELVMARPIQFGKDFEVPWNEGHYINLNYSDYFIAYCDDSSQKLSNHFPQLSSEKCALITLKPALKRM